MNNKLTISPESGKGRFALTLEMILLFKKKSSAAVTQTPAPKIQLFQLQHQLRLQDCYFKFHKRIDFKDFIILINLNRYF